MWTSTGSTTNGFAVFITMAPPVPTCNACRESAVRKTPDGKLWCLGCLAVQCAPELFELLFGAAPPDQRSRLYRSLAAVFHPDLGGNERMMTVLNAVKERFP